MDELTEELTDRTDDAIDNDETKPGAHKCSFFGCRPRCLQFFAKPYWFMLVLNSLTLCEGAIVSGMDNYDNLNNFVFKIIHS